MGRASVAQACTCTERGKLFAPRRVGRTIAGKPIKLPRNMNRMSDCSKKSVGICANAARGATLGLNKWWRCWESTSVAVRLSWPVCV